LYAIKKPKTLLASLLNSCGLVTSIFDLVLGWRITTISSTAAASTSNA